MRKLKKIAIISGLAINLILSGCQNVFQSASNQKTDEALFEDAQKLIDAQDWDTAISKFSSMSVTYQKSPEVIEAWAGAYAGKCGLDFISYFTSLGSASLAGSTIFKYLMSAWTNVAVDPASCTLAQKKIEEISANPANRTSGENLFMAVLGMVKVGVYLRAKMDTDNDGTTDSAPAGYTYASCAASRLSDADLNEVITGMGLITSNLTYLTAVLASGSVTSALDGVNSVCSGLSGACGKTDPTAVTGTDRTMFRELLSTGPSNSNYPIGIETCNKDFLNPPGNFCCP